MVMALIQKFTTKCKPYFNSTHTGKSLGKTLSLRNFRLFRLLQGGASVSNNSTEPP